VTGGSGGEGECLTEISLLLLEQMATVLGKRGAHDMCSKSPRKRVFKHDSDGGFHAGGGFVPRHPLGEVELNSAVGVSLDGGVSCAGPPEAGGAARRLQQGADGVVGGGGGLHARGPPGRTEPGDAVHGRNGAEGNAWSSDIEHWMDEVVKEMSQGTNLEDAKRRGSSMLRSLLRRGTGSGPLSPEDTAASGEVAMVKAIVGENERLRNQLKVFANENHILKRAVASQCTKLAQGQNDLMRTKHELEQSRDESHKLRAENQMISFHLQQMSSRFCNEPWMQPPRNPDVF